MASVTIERCNGVGRLVLARAEALNALSRQFCGEIDEALECLEAREDIRVILISSSLRHFSAGADIREMAGITAAEAEASGFTGCVSALSRIRKPVVVAVRGMAAGGGCELVEMCDVVIAAATARFCHPEVTLAAMPGAGGTQRLARAVGKHVALDLLLTGRALTAHEALAVGLVSRVVPDEELETKSMEIASIIASHSGPVCRRIKEAVNHTQIGLAEGLAMERDSFHRCFHERDFREGLAAFVEKRPAVFLHK